MKFEKLTLSNLRNDEHFQFGAEFRDAVVRFDAAVLKIEPQFAAYLDLYNQEDTALKKIIKSAITAEIQDADSRRDQLFRGLAETNKTALKHFDAEVQAAARRLKIVFDTYGNLASKPLNEQTSAVYNMLQDLNSSKYAADAVKVGLTPWKTELQAANEEFDRLKKERYDEAAEKTNLVLRQVRTEVDAQYRLITARIEALVIVEGAAAYLPFINYFNVVIKKYANILARRSSKKKTEITDNEMNDDDEL